MYGHVPQLAYDAIDLKILVERVEYGFFLINENLDFEIFFTVELPPNIRLHDFNNEITRAKGLDARGISEKINHGVAIGFLDEKLHPFKISSFEAATVWDLINIIQYVYGFDLHVEDYHIILEYNKE